jgi:hypothetical protein
MTKSIIARYIALPAVSAGILGGAALGLAGMANAGTYPTHDPSPRPGIVARPTSRRSRRSWCTPDIGGVRAEALSSICL